VHGKEIIALLLLAWLCGEPIDVRVGGLLLGVGVSQGWGQDAGIGYKSLQVAFITCTAAHTGCCLQDKIFASWVYQHLLCAATAIRTDHFASIISTLGHTSMCVCLWEALGCKILSWWQLLSTVVAGWCLMGDIWGGSLLSRFRGWGGCVVGHQRVPGMCVALCGSESGLGPSTRVCRHRKCIQPIHPPSKVVTVEVRYMCVCTHSICVWQPRRQGAVFMEVAEHRELNNVESTHCLCTCFSGLYISSSVPRVSGFALTDG
jgi:hypothetical protein